MSMPDWPVAAMMNESLVEVSPSTVMRLNERLAISSASLRSTGWAMPASVARKLSMVAMLGRIMPAPLLMPVKVTVLPPICARCEWILGSVSVVMMPCAALNHWSGPRLSSAAGRAAVRRSSGSGSRMTPVEKGRICWAGTPISWPSAPVPALALPVLMTRARMGPPAAKWASQTCTGAARKRLRVNTPATLVPCARRKTVRSRRLALRMPASVTPISTPATGKISDSEGICRLTAMTWSLGLWEGMPPFGRGETSYYPTAGTGHRRAARDSSFPRGGAFPLGGGAAPSRARGGQGRPGPAAGSARPVAARGHHLQLEFAQRLVQRVAAGLGQVVEHALDPAFVGARHARRRGGPAG